MEVKSNHEIAKSYIQEIENLTYEDLAEALTYKWFRLNSLYHIKDKSGRKVLFEPNKEQESFYLGQHTRDIILKARQLGFTTFKMISDLDDCLFIKNHIAGCICHNFDSAKDIYENKIRFAYRNITKDQRELLLSVGYRLPSPVNDRNNGYIFDNGSSIAVSTGYRGGTLQSLHVSEFGKICRQFPDKATEIVTGAFEAVAKENTITIESTAEGREGYFYDYCDRSQKREKRKDKLTALDFKFHFFPWYLNDDYTLDDDVAIPEHLERYFAKISAETGRIFTEGQKRWYTKKESDLGDKVKREYPSTPKEAFEQSVEGAYYEKQFTKIYKEGRICEGFNNDAPVNTAWDLGIGDSTAIWFYQLIGNEIHLIDYYENSGEGLQHYAEVLKKKGYEYKTHYAPHDIENRDFSGRGKSRKDLAAEGFEIDGKIYRIIFETVSRLDVDTGINHVRTMLDRCVFDKDKCEQGIKCLENYRKEWNDKLGCWRDKPLHDWSSHGADAFRYLAVSEEGQNKPAAAVRMRF